MALASPSAMPMLESDYMQTGLQVFLLNNLNFKIGGFYYDYIRNSGKKIK